MSRLPTLLFGMLLGGLLMFSALKYHVVRASDGIHFVPKMSSGFEDVYVDVRQFGVTEWEQHRPLAVAMVRAGKGDLIRESVVEDMRISVYNALQGLSGNAQGRY